VRFISASRGENSRGNTASLLLVANEAQDIEPDVWDAVFAPMAASSNATTLFLGTVWSGTSLLARQMRLLADLERGDGVQRVRSLQAPFSVHLLRLRSPAPDPPSPAAVGGRVVDAGTLGNSSVEGVRVDLDSPAWLVLGQSFSEGWRASCDGRSLGEPSAINGYANGWRAPADCRDVEFEFAPQSGVRAGYATWS
jgi:hypothetical protein